MGKILVIVGTRPEAIKLAPVILELRAKVEPQELVVCSTGQHTELLDTALASFGVVPDLRVMLDRGDGSLASLTSELLLQLSKVIHDVEPNLTIVHGDTTSALAGALVSFYARVSVAHVEAGLRSGDINSPFPEEVNRQLISKMASLHFAPTVENMENLRSEGVLESSIFVTGNTVIDALQRNLRQIRSSPNTFRTLSARLIELLGFDFSAAEFILVTAHRRENLGEGLESICIALQQLSMKFPDMVWVFPMHPNPAIREVVRGFLGQNPNFRLIEPLDYIDFCILLDECFLVVTDSGGLQEEAPSLDKPVVVLRNETERKEALHAGTVLLAGTEVNRIVESVSRLVQDRDAYLAVSSARNPYGDGLASKRIAEIVIDLLGSNGG